MKIAVMEAEARQEAIKKILTENGHEVISLSSLEKHGEGISWAVLPLPFSRDGVHVANGGYDIEDFVRILKGVPIVFYGGKCEKLSSELKSSGIESYDYNTGERFLYDNARMTAEAAVSLIISNTDFSLVGADCHIVGFGRIGKLLAHFLSLFGTDITVYARRESDLAYASAMGYNIIDDSDGINTVTKPAILVNTVPQRIIGESCSESLSNTVVFDLAGKGSLDALNGVKIVNGLSLPSRFMPESAARTVIDSIKEILKQR